jgi:hypothetical protein
LNHGEPRRLEILLRGRRVFKAPEGSAIVIYVGSVSGG